MNSQDASHPAQPHRRWRQFSLRFLLAAMLVSALPLAWVKVKLDQASVQRAAVERIRQSGGDVVYDYEAGYPDKGILGIRPSRPGPAVLRCLLGDDFFFDVEEVCFDFATITAADLRGLEVLPRLKVLELRDWNHRYQLGQVEGLTNLEILDLRDCSITDQGLAKLQGLTSIRVLDLEATRITPAGLLHLGGLTNLAILGLSQCRVTDLDLRHLSGCRQLNSLDLRGTRIRDQDLATLHALARLTYLDLMDTRITDAGLVHLESLTDLKTLRLSGPPREEISHSHGVTQAGVDRLQQKLPKLLNVTIVNIPHALPYAPWLDNP